MTLRTLRMQLNTFYSGPQAWFFLADARGYRRDEGLALDFTEGDTAANTIPKMAAHAGPGGFDVGYGDINALIEHVAAGKRNAPLAVAPRDHLRFIECHDHIPELYGMALMVNRLLATHEPHTVQALLRALNRGLADTVADPQAAINALAAHSNRIPGKPGMNIASNLRRLQGTLELEMGRAEGAVLGIGDLDDARFAAGIDLIVDTKNYPYRPKPAELFSRAFLPPLADRVRNLA